MHSEQAIVKPAGTGTPRFVISARFAPFPPSTLFISRVPSAAPLPKKKTDCVMLSAAAAESKLLGVGRRRSWIVARETGVAESIRAVRYGFEHSLERQVSERVHFESSGYVRHLEIGGDQLVAIGRVDAVIARARDGRGADAHVHLASACCANHRYEPFCCRTANNRIVHHYDALPIEHLAHRVVLHLHLGVATGLRRLNERAADVVIANQSQLERQL